MKNSTFVQFDNMALGAIKSDQNKVDFALKGCSQNSYLQFVISVVVDCRFARVNHSDSMPRRAHVLSSIWLARQPNGFRVINQALWNGYGILMDRVPAFSNESIISNLWTSSNFADGPQRKREWITCSMLK
jgi:hypothetical protein